MFHINKANFIVWLSCNILQLFATCIHQLYSTFLLCLVLSRTFHLTALAVLTACTWVWGPESSVWLLGFVDIRSGVALLGSVAQRSLLLQMHWIPLTWHIELHSLHILIHLDPSNRTAIRLPPWDSARPPSPSTFQDWGYLQADSPPKRPREIWKVKMRHNKVIRSPEKCTERVFFHSAIISSASR